jgi:hypothetical protein
MKTTVRSVAVAFLVVCVGYYLWHGLTYAAPADAVVGDLPGWVGWQLALPILALTLVPMVFAFSGDGILPALTGRNSAAFRDALIGLGTVTAVRQTGLTLNDQPQLRIDLRVEGADGRVFDSTATLIVPLVELAAMRPGAVLAVRYLPDRTDKVEIDRSGDLAAAQRVMNAAMLRRGVTTETALDVAERGIAAQAVVQSLDATGEIRDGIGKLAIGLLVNRPDGGTFAARVQKFVPPASVSRVQVGRVVQVRYLPEREDELVLTLPVNS